MVKNICVDQCGNVMKVTNVFQVLLHVNNVSSFWPLPLLLLRQPIVYLVKNMARKGETLARTDFPLYSIRMIGDMHVMVAGGGGQARTGVENAIV